MCSAIALLVAGSRNQLASVKSLAGEFVYGYNEANPALLTKMTGPAHEVETSYEPHRNLVTGVVNKAKADSKLSTKHEEPSTLSSYTYANDLLGRRETISQGGEGFGMLKLGQNKVEVAYNDRSEVTGAVYRSEDEARQTFDYAYDAIGNRRTAVSSRVTGQESREEKVSYETNALNQYQELKNSSVTSVSSVVKPIHDLDGNLLEDARNTYTWNADNNLIRVDAKDGSLRLEYVYDHQSRRTVRTETTNPGTKNEAQKTTYYLYDAWNLLAELEETKSEEPGTKHFVQRTFTWGRDLSGSLQGAGGVGGLLAITEGNETPSSERSTRNKEQGTNGETRFALYDANGNIGQLIDERGKTVAAYTYDPFGNVTEMAGTEASGNPWRFSTKPVEEGTGWLYYGYRWLDTVTGRWVGRDPIGERGGINLYGFVENRGLQWIDPVGLSSGGDTNVTTHVNLSRAPEINHVMILGYVGRGADPAADGTTPKNPKSGIRKAFDPIAELKEYDVDLYAWNADATTSVSARLVEHYSDPKCDHMTVIIVGHSFGGDRAIATARWFDQRLTQMSKDAESEGPPTFNIHLIVIDAITRRSGTVYDPPPPVTSGPGIESLGVFLNFYQTLGRPYGIRGSEISSAENIRVPGVDHIEIDDHISGIVAEKIRGILEGI